MRKSDIERSRAISARVKRRQRRASPQAADKPVSPQHGVRWRQNALRFGRRIFRYKKIGGGVIATIAAVYAAFPHFSIARETTNSYNPYIAEFVFKKEGWLPATEVKIECNMSVDLQHMHLDDNTSIEPISNFLWGAGEFTRPCRVLSAPESSPINNGRVIISVDYTFMFFPYAFSSSKTFSFRYDSQSAGYVYVPDI